MAGARDRHPISGHSRSPRQIRVKIQAASCWTSLDSALLTKLARKTIQKTWHPGTWRHFVASRAAQHDASAIRLLQRRERERGRISEAREL
jgi:hypothetical protein